MREFTVQTQNLHPLLTYLMTNKMKATPTSQYQPDTVVEGDFEYRSFKVRVTSISDRGDYLYVGYRPLDSRHGLFGYTRLYKDKEKQPEFGTIGFEDVRKVEQE